MILIRLTGNKIAFQIDEAVNGLEAVEMTNQHRLHARFYSMIFMVSFFSLISFYVLDSC